MQEPKKSSYTNTNGMPRLDDGGAIHLAVGPGQAAHRVLSVGSHSRAKLLSTLLHKEKPVEVIESSRGFATYTGEFNSVPVSIIATGMGIANMDFVVREIRAVVTGPMAIVRYGTCGSVHAEVPTGSVSVATPGSVLVQRNPNGFSDPTNLNLDDCYQISNVVLPNAALSKGVFDELSQEFAGEHKVVEGLNATACSFYSSQGRIDSNFTDGNEKLIDHVKAKIPQFTTMEMESFHLLDLARCASSESTIAAAAAVMVVANRSTGDVIDEPTLKKLELAGGKAILSALCKFIL